MINKEMMQSVLKEDVIKIINEEELPTPRLIKYVCVEKGIETPKTILAMEMAIKCIKWAYIQGYSITLNIEDNKDWDKEYQWRANITPTEYKQESFISENEWDCIFGATEKIESRISEQIDELFSK